MTFLREKAKRATSGKWHCTHRHVNGAECEIHGYKKEDIVWSLWPLNLHVRNPSEELKANFEYFETFCPERVLGILDQLDNWQDSGNRMAAQIDALQKKVDSAREVVKNLVDAADLFKKHFVDWDESAALAVRANEARAWLETYDR